MGLSVSRHVYCDDFPRAIHAFLPIYGDAIEMIMGECTCIATNAVGSCILQEFEWKKVENCKKKFGKFNIFMRIYPYFHLPREGIICSCGGVFPVCMVELPVIDFPPVTKK